MKKLLALLMAVVMLLSLAACKSDDSEDEKKLSKEEKFLQKLEDRLDEIVDAMEDGDEEKAQQLYEDLQELEEEYNKILEELKEEDEDKAEEFEKDFEKLEEKFLEKMEGFEFGDASVEIPLPDEGGSHIGVDIEDHIQPSEPVVEKTELPEIEEIVAVDNDECVVKITGIEQDEYMGLSLKVYLENKSSDKTYSYGVGNASINGVMVDASLYADVAAGKRANKTIDFYGALEDYDIGDYTDIELMIVVTEADNYEAEAVAAETVHIYPYGEEKAENYVRPAQSTDVVVLDNEYATIIATGWEKDEYLGYIVNYYVVNKTDTVLAISGDDFCVNNYMLDSYLYVGVAQGKSAFTYSYWYEETMAENNITSIDTLEFTLQVYDYADWSVDYFVDETVKLEF